MEQMSFIRGLRARAMFSGYGVYQHDRMFAIIVNGTLYLKADPTVQRDFEAKNLSRFSYTARGKLITLKFYEAPAEVFEGNNAMRLWVEKALGASIR